MMDLPRASSEPMSFIASLPIHYLGDPVSGKGRVGFCGLPGSRKDASGQRHQSRALAFRDCERILGTGARLLVSCMEPWEMQRLEGAGELPTIARCVGLRHEWLTTPDTGVPVDLAEAKRLILLATREAAQGRSVVFHCRGGVGRSAALACATLGIMGVPPDKAIQLARDREPMAVETEIQVKFVEALSRWWANGVAGLEQSGVKVKR